MHHIQQHRNTESMSSIDKIFQILGCTEAVAGSKERGNMVAERAVIRMLLNGHNLHHVVPQFCHTRQHVIRKLPVAVDALFFTRHTHMRLIDEGSLHSGRIPACILPQVRLRRVPDDAAVVEGRSILRRIANPGRHAVLVYIVSPHHMYLHALAVLQSICRQAQLPHPVCPSLHRVCLAVPVVEIADKIKLARARRPFAVHPFARGCIAVEPHARVGKGKIHQRTMTAADTLHLSIE